MKHILTLTLLPAVIAFTATCRASEPIIQTRFTADPAPLVSNGVVYLYTTQDEDDAPAGMAQFRMRNWLLYTSTDMVNWTDKGTVANLRSFSWAGKAWGGFENGAWAHQTIARNGKFYMYCAVQGGGIGVLVADKPEGPFTDPIGKALIGPQYDSIDPTVFIDDDGQAYLSWGNPNLWSVKLNNDMISTSGEIIKDPSIAKVAGQPDPFHYQEGPWIYKRDKNYYNAYASTCCPEGIGYAMSKNPIGPWEFKGYIMKPDRRASGNHPGIIDYKGKSYIFGFNYKLNFMQTKEHHERRSVCVAEIKYNPDGTIQELPWWEEAEAVKQLELLNPYKRTQAETIAWSEGLKSKTSLNGDMNVYPTREGAYSMVKGVNFGAKGAAAFTASVALDTKPTSVKGGRLELRLDSVNGRLAGVLPLSYTGGEWKNMTTTVKGAVGVHDLYLIFKGDSIDNLLKIDYWKFTEKTVWPQLVALNATVERYKIDSSSSAANRTPFNVSAVYSNGTSKDVTSQVNVGLDEAAIASVSKGIITGKKLGEGVLNVKFKGKSDSLPIIVKNLETEFIPRNLIVSIPEAKIIAGKTQAFTLRAEFLDGHIEDVTNRAIYAVENPVIANVKDGVITALKLGATTVRAEFKGERGGPITASIGVVVSLRDPFVQNEAEDFNEKQGIVIENSTETAKNICDAQDGEWIKFNDVDFGTGALALDVRVASATEGGNLEIRLDRLDGPIIGNCKVERTGGWQKWVTKSCEIKEIKGIHDVYFKFVGAPGVLFNMNWWKFSKSVK